MPLKSRRVIFSDTARNDLRRIRIHLDGFNHDPELSRRTIVDLVNKFYELARLGVTGSRRSFAPEHVRAFPYKRHCFYFTLDEESLILLRVLGQAEDVQEIIFDPKSGA